MVFFCDLPFVFGPSPCTGKGRGKPGGQREGSSEGTASVPPAEAARKGRRAGDRGEGEKKDLKAAGRERVTRGRQTLLTP